MSYYFIAQSPIRHGQGKVSAFIKRRFMSPGNNLVTVTITHVSAMLFYSEAGGKLTVCDLQNQWTSKSTESKRSYRVYFVFSFLIISPYCTNILFLCGVMKGLMKGMLKTPQIQKNNLPYSTGWRFIDVSRGLLCCLGHWSHISGSYSLNISVLK